MGDVYAFGMVLYEMTSRRCPYENLPNEKVVQLIENGGRPNIPEGVLEPFKALIQDCWHASPAKRPAIVEVQRRLGSMLDWYDSTGGDRLGHEQDMMTWDALEMRLQSK